MEIQEETVNRWRTARKTRNLPSVLFHAPTEHSLMGKDLLKHGYNLCDAREVSADHVMLELVAPWYTISTFRFTKAEHLQCFMRIDFSTIELKPLTLITRVEYYIQYLYGHHVLDGFNDPQGLITAGLQAPYGFNKGTEIILDWGEDKTNRLSRFNEGWFVHIVGQLKGFFPQVAHLVKFGYKVSARLFGELEFEVVKDEVNIECWVEEFHQFLYPTQQV